MQPTTPTRSQRPASIEASYPAHYRRCEVANILQAVRGRYSLLVCGIGGVGKSHLLRFLCFHEAVPAQLGRGASLRLYLDCNAAIDDDAATIFRALLIEAGSEPPASREATSALAALRAFLAAQIDEGTSLLIVLDRFERIPAHLQPAILDGLRHLRDYLGRRVSYLLGCRTPPAIAELSGEFDDLLAAPPVIWVGLLPADDAAWLVASLFQERNIAAAAPLIAETVALIGGHPRLLRAAALAWAEHPTRRRSCQPCWPTSRCAGYARASGRIWAALRSRCAAALAASDQP